MKRISGLGIDSITLNEVHEVKMDKTRKDGKDVNVALPQDIFRRLSIVSSELNVSIPEILRSLTTEFAAKYDSACDIETVDTKSPKTRRYGKFLGIKISNKIALPLKAFTEKHNSTIQDILRAMFAKMTDTEIHTNKHIDHTIPDPLVVFVESVNLDRVIEQSKEKQEAIGEDGEQVSIYVSMDLYQKFTELCKRSGIKPANLGRTLAKLAVEYASEVSQEQDE